jgi:hypothetical protein
LAIVPLTFRMYDDLLERLSQPLQSVASYTLYKKLYGPPFRGYGGRGVRKGHFSRRSKSIKGTAWESQVQRYPGRPDGPKKRDKEDHTALGAIRTKLEKYIYYAGDRKVIAELGYPPEVHPLHGPYRYIGAVLLGTPAMQARPFLPIMLNQYRSEYLRKASRIMKEAFDHFGRRFPRTQASIQKGLDRDFEALAARENFLGAGLGQPSVTTPGFRGRSGVNTGSNRTMQQSIRRLRRRIRRAKDELQAIEEHSQVEEFLTRLGKHRSRRRRSR